MKDRIKDYSEIMVHYRSFCEKVLGMVDNENYGLKDLTQEHNKLINFLEGEERSKIILMPRYSLKSTLITVGWSLFKIIRNPNVRILIYSDTAKKAQGFLQGIKNHILGTAPNSKFKEYFDGYDNDIKSGSWNDSEITVRKRTAQFIEPTVDTGGIETTKVGRHYDIIFFDDIVSDVNTTTKAQMDKTYDCYKKSLSLLKPDGEVVIVGTRWAFGDAYGRILQEDKNFGTFIRKAVVRGAYPFEQIGLTKEFLDKQLAAQGSYFWNCLYQNSPVSEEEAIFKKDKFSFYDSVDPSGLFITATLDPAGEGEDYTAITVVGTDKDNVIYILDIINRKLKMSQITDKIIELAYKWKFRKLGVEINFFEHLEKEIIAEREKQKEENPEFHPFGLETFRATAKAGDSKFHRIQSLQPYHEREALKFPGKTVESLSGGFYDLADQMLQFTPNHSPQNDDALDALSYQIKLIRPGEKVAKENLEENSFKRMYLDHFKRKLERNMRLPSRYRQRIVDPIFGGV